jgi:hypothetical protein
MSVPLGNLETVMTTSRSVPKEKLEMKMKRRDVKNEMVK